MASVRHMVPLFLRSKYDRFAVHHDRVLNNPDAAKAPDRFARALRRCRRISRLRIASYALIYLGTIAAGVLALLRYAALLAELTVLIRFLMAFAPALAIVGLLGVLACTRALAMFEVDLYYFSIEASLGDRR